MCPKSSYILLLAMISLFSCEKEISNTENHQAFIGGEIINPYSEFIILSKSREIIDTLFLDDKNRFAYKLTDLQPGLYDFYDGKEVQTFLLEASDSLMLRLNTLDFDESLVYTGTNARENNFLMDLFLENEQQEKKILALSQLDPKQFDEKISALRTEKLKKLKAFKLKHKTSKLFYKVAEANINYKYYSNKEFYPFANYSKSEFDMFKSLPKDFYNYREEIDYNSELLKNYRPYNTFLRFHINNIALKEHFSHSDDKHYNEHLLDYNLDKLKIIDDNIDNAYIKNGLLYYTMIHFISISKNTQNYDALFQSFKAKSKNEKHIKRASRIVNSYKRLKPGQLVPSLTLFDLNDKEVELHTLITKPTVIYFWSKENKDHITDAHKRAHVLELKYPEINFLAINTDSISYNEQSNILRRHEVQIAKEYRFKFPDKSKEVLSVKPINNVFLINKKQQIVNAKANMFTIDFEMELLSLIDKE